MSIAAQDDTTREAQTPYAEGFKQAMWVTISGIQEPSYSIFMLGMHSILVPYQLALFLYLYLLCILISINLKSINNTNDFITLVNVILASLKMK